jgi:hypothetical protein
MRRKQIMAQKTAELEAARKAAMPEPVKEPEEPKKRRRRVAKVEEVVLQ